MSINSIWLVQILDIIKTPEGIMPPDYLSEIEQYNIRQARPKPGRCALLVIDMQQYFLSIATPILGNILSVIEGGISVLEYINKIVIKKRFLFNNYCYIVANYLMILYILVWSCNKYERFTT